MVQWTWCCPVIGSTTIHNMKAINKPKFECQNKHLAPKSSRCRKNCVQKSLRGWKCYFIPAVSAHTTNNVCYNIDIYSLWTYRSPTGIIDDHEHGASRTWATDRQVHLCVNKRSRRRISSWNSRRGNQTRSYRYLRKRQCLLMPKSTLPRFLMKVLKCLQWFYCNKLIAHYILLVRVGFNPYNVF